MARLTAHFDPSTVLFDQAVNAGQAEAGSFGPIFSRKERFKEPSLNLWAHPATGIRDHEAHEDTWMRFFMASSLHFIKQHCGGAQGERATIGHGFACVSHKVTEDLLD